MMRTYSIHENTDGTFHIFMYNNKNGNSAIVWDNIANETEAEEIKANYEQGNAF
jgi:hypothetical protein